MKPKNRVICPDCGRPKILFESEKKAKNFIKFNGHEINPEGNKELRVYYCPACCGYHISSHEYNKSFEGRTEKLIRAYELVEGGNNEVDMVISGSELFKTLEENNFETRKAVNKFLKTVNCREEIKTYARIKYYKEKKL